MSKRAQEAREISRDSGIVGTLESEAEFSRHDEVKALSDRILMVRDKIRRAQVKKTAWIDRVSTEVLRSELKTAPVLEIDHMDVIRNVEQYLKELEGRYP